MDLTLDAVDVRVLGCLVEKESTTPEYYPLTLKGLTTACNQKSNRDPVMSLEETDVVRSLDRLRTEHLVFETYIAGSRVPKYEHRIGSEWSLNSDELAALCVLMLRGPQTIGEIRARTGRLYDFSDVGEVSLVMNRLEAEEKGSFVIELPRQPGRRENRFMHLLAGEPSPELLEETAAPEAATVVVRAENERISELEARVEDLEVKLDQLRTAFKAFESQFE
jgi:uncharacterized protein YceH (UPF0502 family)